MKFPWRKFFGRQAIRRFITSSFFNVSEISLSNQWVHGVHSLLMLLSKNNRYCYSSSAYLLKKDSVCNILFLRSKIDYSCFRLFLFTLSCIHPSMKDFERITKEGKSYCRQWIAYAPAASLWWRQEWLTKYPIERNHLLLCQFVQYAYSWHAFISTGKCVWWKNKRTRLQIVHLLQYWWDCRWRYCHGTFGYENIFSGFSRELITDQIEIAYERILWCDWYLNYTKIVPECSKPWHRPIFLHLFPGTVRRTWKKQTRFD